MKDLLDQIKNCEVCKTNLPLEPRPVLSANSKSKIVIIGQAPGVKVHESGIPWDDRSGDLLRNWLGIEKKTFYDADNIAIIPMGFCYPGKGKSGDLPPRPECAPLWHKLLLQQMADQKLTLLIGQYSQRYYLDGTRKKNLTETVKSFQEYLPVYFPLPHPSPRNRFWLQKNPWFQTDLLPVLQNMVSDLLR